MRELTQMACWLHNQGENVHCITKPTLTLLPEVRYGNHVTQRQDFNTSPEMDFNALLGKINVYLLVAVALRPFLF